MKAKLGAVISSASGSLGGHVLQGSPHGLMLRTGSSRCKSVSSSQVNNQQFYRSVVSAWSMLPEPDRISWNQSAPSGTSGFHYFISLNMHRLIDGRFIARNFADYKAFNVPTSWIQGNWPNTLGTGSGMVAANDGSLVGCGGSGFIVSRVTDGADDYQLYNGGLTGISSFAIVKCSSGVLVQASSTPNTVYRSVDNGFTWSPVNIGYTLTSGQSMVMSPSGSIYLCGLGSNSIFESTDDGLHWSPILSISPLTGGRFMRFISDGSLMVEGTGSGVLLRKPADSSFFQNVSPNPSATAWAFIVNVYANVVLTTDAASPYYWRSVDFGKTFTKTPYSVPSSYITLRNPCLKGILFGRNVSTGILYYSYDLGYKWQALFKPTYQTRPNDYFLSPLGYVYVQGATSARPIRGLLIPT